MGLTAGIAMAHMNQNTIWKRNIWKQVKCMKMFHVLMCSSRLRCCFAYRATSKWQAMASQHSPQELREAQGEVQRQKELLEEERQMSPD